MSLKGDQRLIPEAALDMAFDYLRESSAEIAAARGNVIRMEYKAKAVFARKFLASSGSSVESRKADATASDEYAEAMEAVAVAEETWERMKDQRNRAELIIEAWRTENATRRAIDKIR